MQKTETTNDHENPSTAAATDTLSPGTSGTTSDGGQDAPPRSHKTCRRCREELPITAFYQQRRCRDAYRLECKRCTGLRGRQAREAKRELTPETQRCSWCDETKRLDEFTRDGRCIRARRRVCEACHTQALRNSETQHDLNVPDDHIIPGTPLHQRRIDLGLAIAAATFPIGHRCTYEELAAFTGLTPGGVQRIELRALAKLRTAAMRLLRKREISEATGEEQP